MIYIYIYILHLIHYHIVFLLCIVFFPTMTRRGFFRYLNVRGFTVFNPSNIFQPCYLFWYKYDVLHMSARCI